MPIFYGRAIAREDFNLGADDPDKAFEKCERHNDNDRAHQNEIYNFAIHGSTTPTGSPPPNSWSVVLTSANSWSVVLTPAPLLRQMAMEKSGSSMALISHCEDVLCGCGGSLDQPAQHGTKNQSNKATEKLEVASIFS